MMPKVLIFHWREELKFILYSGFIILWPITFFNNILMSLKDMEGFLIAEVEVCLSVYIWVNDIKKKHRKLNLFFLRTYRKSNSQHVLQVKKERKSNQLLSRIKFPSALTSLGMSQSRSNSFVFHFNMELETKIKPDHLCLGWEKAQN